jgi:hypothetical protein
LPILRKNWDVIPGESLNFNIDYREGDHLDPENLVAIDLTNYVATFIATKDDSVLVELTEPYDVYKDAVEGHLEFSISPENVLKLVQSDPPSYAVFLENINDSSDKFAILRGHIRVEKNA